MSVGEFRINGERIEAYIPDYHKSFIEGYDNDTFLPDANVTSENHWAYYDIIETAHEHYAD